MSKEKKLDKLDKKEVEELIETILEKNKEGNLSALLQNANISSELYEVVAELMSGKENIHLKTEILKPKSLAVLSIVEHFASDLLLEKTANTLFNFQQHYLENMTSYNRGARKEIVEILKAKSEELKQSDEIVD